MSHHPFTHAFIHWWQRLQCKVPTAHQKGTSIYTLIAQPWKHPHQYPWAFWVLSECHSLSLCFSSLFLVKLFSVSTILGHSVETKETVLKMQTIMRNRWESFQKCLGFVTHMFSVSQSMFTFFLLFRATDSATAYIYHFTENSTIEKMHCLLYAFQLWTSWQRNKTRQAKLSWNDGSCGENCQRLIAPLLT